MTPFIAAGYGEPKSEASVIIRASTSLRVVGVVAVGVRVADVLDALDAVDLLDDLDGACAHAAVPIIVFIGEYENGTLGTIQTSFVTVGSYPGIEARIYGERGAIICRLIQERGTPERIWTAQPDPDAVDKAADTEFVEREIPEEFYPEGGTAKEDWRTLFYANLIADFIDEIAADSDRNQGNFDDGARVQESINAMERAAQEERWVDLPPEALT
jgi:predicted dehydrogenase